MPTRREIMDRAESRLRAKGGDEEGLEASRCFLRAMLTSVDDNAAVPQDLVARVAEFLKLDLDELMNGPTARRSARPPAANSLAAPPGERPRRVLFLGRGDAARLVMIDAIARATLAGEVDVRAASVSPVPFDARALRALRHAGYSTEGLAPRPMTVDDLSWADVVVTLSGEREDWDRFVPRSIVHQHEPVEDPVPLAKDLVGSEDENEPFRAVLRAIERLVAVMRPPRSSRMPAARPSSPRMPALAPQRTPVPALTPPRTPMPALGPQRTPMFDPDDMPPSRRRG
ncbi:MAG: arsenate-mycothiol transferase ArsC [Polyangiales bacterium]